jgi:DNA-binding GntR family transcriptional regulator
LFILRGPDVAFDVSSTTNGDEPRPSSVTRSAEIADLVQPDLDRGSPVPLYYQLARTLQRLIESGGISVGTRLGNESDLAQALGVSRPTIRRALGYLADGGLVLRMRGMGTVVMPMPIRRSVALTSVYDDMVESGHTPKTEVLILRTELPSDAVAAGLLLPADAEVHYMRRLRLVDDEPLVVMENYLPRGLVDLDRQQLERTGLYRLLRTVGIIPRVASQTISARGATSDEAHLLGLDRGSPILQLQRVSYDEKGRAIEYASHAYIAARHSFQMNLTSESRAAEP